MPKIANITLRPKKTTQAMKAIEAAEKALHPEVLVPGEFLEAKKQLLDGIGGLEQGIKEREKLGGIHRLAVTPRRLMKSFGVENILGVQIGLKNASSKLSVIVRVLQKADESAVGMSNLLPKSLWVGSTEIPVDVVETRPVYAQSMRAKPGSAIESTSFPGFYGTLGGLVAILDGAGSAIPYILSNTHVLSGESNQGVPNSTEITSRGTLIGLLTDYEEIVFGGDNWIDAGIALTQTNLTDPVPIDPDLLTIEFPAVAFRGQTVKKIGAFTGVTYGTVTDTFADTPVGFHNGASATYNDVIHITGNQFAGGGDSGALVLDAYTNEPVGLHFAGDGFSNAFAIPIKRIVTRFGIEFFIRTFE